MRDFLVPTNLDYRAIFANRVLKLIYEKHNGDLDKAVVEAAPFFEEMDEIIRNVYELIDSEIPLWKYNYVKNGTKEQLGYETEEEREEELAKTIKACRVYYGEPIIEQDEWVHFPSGRSYHRPTMIEALKKWGELNNEE
jgi:hypothetical protein